MGCYNGQSITYDVSDNPLNYMGHNLTWTMGRQLSSYDNIAYTYDENGIRTSKTSNGVTTEYYLDGTRLVEQTDETNTLHFNYDRTGEVIGFTHYYLSTGVDDPTMAEYMYVKNAQGDIVGITDPSGKMKVSYTYDPWGRLISVESDLDQYERDIATLNPLRYRGYYYDTDTGLYYLQSRYYDPETGRFINADNVNYIGVSGTKVGYNPFAYCENDPVNNSDPSGFFSIVTSLIIGAFTGLMALYFIDVIVNLITSAKYWWYRTSSNADYVVSAVNGAISTLKTSSKMAIFISTVLSGASYLANCIENGTKVDVISLLLSLAIGAFCGVISGSGIDLKNKLEIVQISNSKLKSLMSARKITMYTEKRKKNLSGIIVGSIRSYISTCIGSIVGKIKDKYGKTVANSVIKKLKKLKVIK